ncbi:hypothetical protein CLOACE_22230 [Clostridium acetireducens DSM 10703]|uniref:Uncharacterized protein n=1 Tax=Clostridium acetireducens DSM 10703 TaxID=1121290 RepID=A0A1E8EVF4_9CLOT|nr:DUF1048 domain-containing protein [Clostridium acetireducens]OFH99489.1 hypothetical protein CLOACE_22230 [Clostridium acetireducens DSM 10703]
MISAIRLRKIRLKEQKKLNDSNLCLYKNITTYIQNSTLTMDEKEEILQQIIDMMLQADIEGKSVDLFIGKDYEEFCKSIIKEYNNSKSTTYKIINYIQKYLMWMISIAILMSIFNVFNGDLANLSITLNQFIFANELAIFMIFVLKIKNQENIDVIPIQVPFYKQINFKKYTNQKSSEVSFFIFIFITIIINFFMKKFLGTNIMNYNINFNNNIYYILSKFHIL